MIFGDLTNVLENEQTIFEAATEKQGFEANYKKPNIVSRLLYQLSHYGMSYDDQIYNNMRAIPADKQLLSKEDQFFVQNMYGGYMNNWKIKSEEEKTFAEKTLSQKCEILRKMAMQSELEDILDIMANECIVYDDDQNYIGSPFIDTTLLQNLTEDAAEEIRKSIDTNFYKIYYLLEWKKKAWHQFKRYLIDGDLAFQIVYDNIERPKTITGIIELNPMTLTKSIERGVTFWYQFKGIQGKEKKLLDAEVIYIKYEDTGVSSRQSYLERLIRPFNIYRIVEQAQVIWTVTQSSFKTMFTIPVGSMSQTKGRQTLGALMNSYREDITFNSQTGELLVNGKTNLPFNKEYWFPENNNGRPEIETLTDGGPSLNDSDQLKYFENKLYKMSKIPQNRFDAEAQSTWFGSDPTQTLRDEINFARFVARLRNSFTEIILKPLRIQLTLNMPALKGDKRILDGIGFKFNSYNQFEEMMNIELMSKRIEFISSMKDSLVETDDEGNETPFFCPRFLVVKYLQMSEADLELNEKYKLEEKIKSKKEGGDKEGGDEGDDEGGGDDGLGLGGGDDEGGSEDEGGGDIDNEMMGDVTGESSETSQL